MVGPLLVESQGIYAISGDFLSVLQGGGLTASSAPRCSGFLAVEWSSVWPVRSRGRTLSTTTTDPASPPSGSLRRTCLCTNPSGGVEVDGQLDLGGSLHLRPLGLAPLRTLSATHLARRIHVHQALSVDTRQPASADMLPYPRAQRKWADDSERGRRGLRRAAIAAMSCSFEF